MSHHCTSWAGGRTVRSLVLLSLVAFLTACGLSRSEPIDFFTATTAVDGELAIRYFDIESDEKSGDAILITSPDGKHLLIDAGIPAAGPKLHELLGRIGVEELEAAVNTHPHIDHIGGFTTLLRTMPVKQFYHNGIRHTTETYRKVQEALEEKEIPGRILREGDRIEFAPGVSIEVLNPPESTHAGQYDLWGTEEHNNHSLTLLVTYEETRFLVTGDLYKTQEYVLVDKYGKRLKADLLHAPHHGDLTSSSSPFIRAVDPEFVVMSANILQSLDVFNRYERLGAEVWTTGLNGNLLFVSDGERLRVVPERESQRR
ncbi:MBL fold metallo-hydrolase [Paenibacillus sp. TRM 82003]|nr:MBL fold metallo-hydrolase [Paenibacillus sp. TRM 82003]